jgi:hypothetical protein
MAHNADKDEEFHVSMFHYYKAYFQLSLLHFLIAVVNGFIH